MKNVRPSQKNRTVIVFTLKVLLLTSITIFQVQAQYRYQAPKGMVLIERDTVQIGSKDGRADEKPTFPFIIRPFLLDVNPVTVKDFRKFVRFTRYTTDAERIGKSYVFNQDKNKWDTIVGAYWLYPFGRDSSMAMYTDPVTHISWNDAKAYAAWLGKRLPTEFEYELVAKKAAKLKLQDINQKLWHWCNDWYRFYGEQDYYTKRINDRKTLRGGKFVHSKAPYRPSQRMSALPYTSTSIFGFRCAKDLQ
ncbi:hypothetical protein BKI52_31505 [marine bacterium AO1-C]|nr:hypothetical protein BKI52_31505 [marine bacterium AO1-C]